MSMTCLEDCCLPIHLTRTLYYMYILLRWPVQFLFETLNRYTCTLYSFCSYLDVSEFTCLFKLFFYYLYCEITRNVIKNIIF